MCGICGFNWQDESLVRSMAQTIIHRGPDQEGVFCSPEVSWNFASSFRAWDTHLQVALIQRLLFMPMNNGVLSLSPG